MESKKYVIAGLKVLMRCTEEHMQRQGAAYLFYFEGEPYIRIEIDPETIKKMNEKHPGLTYDEMEYILTGSRFYFQFIRFGGFLLHSSCVVEDGKAYMFSANPGTGKSTHTALWIKHLGEDKAFILNDDKPAVRLENGVFYAYGTPWSGKTDKNVNTSAPLAGVCLLNRGEKNEIKRISGTKAVFGILSQTVRPKTKEYVEKLLELLSKLINDVPIWELHCNMDNEAARVSYNAMSSVLENKN